MNRNKGSSKRCPNFKFQSKGEEQDKLRLEGTCHLKGDMGEKTMQKEKRYLSMSTC